ncbi:hypothetical protein O181_087998 [Austropuccinia psidii MF-1]|uniref:Uncharacterized protein n=1 Tax=Austropuccinia psidii MF-1 TaxID=1389203 RepID=A0A9Q3P227_9BASI|nr:hypothetical protein [Austropuccinia psidii MF-1]
MDLRHVQDAKTAKPKPSRDRGYTSSSSYITNIVINKNKSKIHPDSGAFCTCVWKNYLEKIHTNWKEQLMPIQGIKLSCASQDMNPLEILEAAMIFPHPAGSIRIKVQFVVMNNCTSKHLILGNDYLNIHVIDINNHKDRYFTIGEKKRQNFSFPLDKRERTVIIKVKNVNKERYRADQLIEAKIIHQLTLEMKGDLIEILF